MQNWVDPTTLNPNSQTSTDDILLSSLMQICFQNHDPDSVIFFSKYRYPRGLTQEDNTVISTHPH